jgi:UDP:flavonoid glycosyltransferase YjiC (YdhE family)
LVIGLGGTVDPAVLGDLPPNVYAMSMAPQTEVLSRADAAIHHGGMGSTNESVLAGCPALVYPFPFGVSTGVAADSTGTAARVQYHRLGIVGDRETDQPQAIQRYLDELLSDNSYATRVEKMRDNYLSYSRENRAVEAVEALLRSPPPTQRPR